MHTKLSRETQLMTPPFDIFEMFSDGGVLWHGSAATLEEAKAQVQEFLVRSPGEYAIHSLQTGNKLVIKSAPDGQGIAGVAYELFHKVPDDECVTLDSRVEPQRIEELPQSLSRSWPGEKMACVSGASEKRCSKEVRKEPSTNLV